MDNIIDTVIYTPVLLIGFNRPDVIKESLSYIRKAKPQKLYVAIDGPREGKDGETALVEEVINIVKQIDWDCETHYKFNESNLGAEVTVSSAVSWVLKNEETVIVLEDDIIAPMSFMRFAQEMLEKYVNAENVYMVSSNQWTPIKMPNDEDYLFGIYGHTWGWATWRRAWERFDLYVNDFDEILNETKLKSLVHSKPEMKYWRKRISKMKLKGAGNNTWDYCWTYIRFKERGFSIIPKHNLTANIGLYGLHADGETKYHNMPFDENFYCKKHPNGIVQYLDFDKYHFKMHINNKASLLKRVYRKGLKLFLSNTMINFILFFKSYIRSKRIKLRSFYLRPFFLHLGGNTKICDRVYFYGLQKNISIGSNVIINEGATIQSCEGAKVIIGNNVTISYEVMILTGGLKIEERIKHDMHVNQSVIIKDGVWIGAKSIILPGVTINENACIAAGSTVTKSVKSDVIVAGSPAREIKNIS